MAVELPSEPEYVAALWQELLDLAEEMPVPWVLIGAQMVALHAWQAEGEPPRPSRDGDVLVDVRRRPQGTRLLSEHLERRGFELQGPSRQGLGHEFNREHVTIDVLAPDNLGARASLETLGRARTVAVPGGTQALARAETIEVRLGRRIGSIPVPNLLGAIVLKVQAIAVDDQPAAQRSDVAILLALVTDRDQISADIMPRERRLLRRYPEFGDSESGVYRGLARAREAAVTFRRLARL